MLSCPLAAWASKELVNMPRRREGRREGGAETARLRRGSSEDGQQTKKALPAGCCCGRREVERTERKEGRSFGANPFASFVGPPSWYSLDLTMASGTSV